MRKNMSRTYVQTRWILDTGASHHMTAYINMLENLYDLNHHPINITVASEQVIRVEKAGKVVTREGLVPKNVLYNPAFNCNFIYVSKLTKDENCIIIYRCLLLCHTRPQLEKVDSNR